MPDKFFPISEDEKKLLTEKAGHLLPQGYKDLSICKVYSSKPSYYPNWCCYHIQKEEDVTVKPLTLFKKQDEVLLLDWKPKTILKFNLEAPLVLSINDITAYVIFFFAHTRARTGKMKIVSSYDDFKWQEEPNGTVKKAISSMVRAPHLISWDDENKSYELGAHILFDYHLFDCRLHINRLGEIEVSERTLQVEDMPLIDESIE